MPDTWQVIFYEVCVLDGDALEVGLEMRSLNLSEEEMEALAEAIQEIIDRLWK